METIELKEGGMKLRIEDGSSRSWLVMQRADGEFPVEITVGEDASVELAFIVRQLPQQQPQVPSAQQVLQYLF